MKNVDIGKLLRIIDRRILILIIVGLVGIVGVQRFFVSATSSSLVAANAERTELSESTDSLETRVEEILSNGTSSIDAMVTRISSMESTLPTEVDDLEFSAEIYRIANDGILVENIAIADTPEQKPGGLQYVLYQVSGKSPFGVLTAFVNKLGVTGKYLATVSDISITPDTRSSTSANTEARPLNAGDSDTKFVITLMVWFDTSDKLIIGTETDEEAVDAEGGQAGEQTQGDTNGTPQQPAQEGGNTGGATGTNRTQTPGNGAANNGATGNRTNPNAPAGGNTTPTN